MTSALSAQIGARIRELRQSRRWSQSEFARRVGISKTSAGQYEVGDRSPSYEVLVRIADLFNVSLDYLIRGNELSEKVSRLPVAQADAIRTIITALSLAYSDEN